MTKIINKVMQNRAPTQFNIVALGASAGGTEALLSFFERMPSDSGLAFIVVQHLFPDFKSLMPEILKKYTKMSIHIVEEKTSIARNTIHLIPPNKNLTIENGQLFLVEQKKRPQINYPIDILFESLALNYKERAIAVVLSGTGTDGSRGIVKIAECGGLVLVQSPDEAQFSGMPQSAIATDVVVYVHPVEQLVDLIVRYSLDPCAFKRKPADRSLYYNAEHEQIFNLLLRKYKLDFNYYKVGTILRRIERRVHALNLHNLQEYIAYLQNSDEEQDILYRDLLIGVTLFFRDPEAFDVLEKKVIPKLFEKQRRAGDDIRIWCPACSTGDEAYSIAILLFEHAEKNKLPLNVKIYATDISTDFLSIASCGIYSMDALQYMSQKRLQHCFIQQDSHYKIIKPIRDMIIFAPHNLLASPPFIKMDLISCRNFLIYVQSTMQQKILSLLHFGLTASGFLFLGPSESIGELSQFVEPISSTWKIYRKTSVQPTHPLFNNNGGPTFSSSALMSSRIERSPVPSIINEIIALQTGDASLPMYVYQALLKDLIPCGFIVDESYRILHVFGRAGEFIFYQEGIAKLDISSLILNTLKSPLNAALYEARRRKSTQKYDGIEISNSKGDKEHIRLTVRPILINTQIRYYCISIESCEASILGEHVKPDSASLSMIHVLEDKLQQTSQSLRNSIEELETTNEELLAANEELQSTNEELQSVNEVLYTANSEHQKKIVELRDARTSIDNLLRSTEVGAIFVDQSLNIRMFTPVVAQFFDLVESDIGRSIKSFIFRANFQELTKKIEWVIKKNHLFEKEIADNKGQWHLLRIFPYLKNGKDLDGAIITMTNINEITQSKIKLKETDEKLNLTLKSSHIGLWRLDFQQDIIEHDSNISELFGLAKNKKIRKYKQLEHLVFSDDRDNVNHILDQVKCSQLRDFFLEFRVLWPDKTLHYIASRGHVYQNEMGNNAYLTGACWDITEQIHTQERLTHLQHREIALDEISDGWWEWDLDSNVFYLSPKLKDVLGYTEHDIANDIHAWEALIDPADRKQAMASVRALCQPGNETTSLQEIRFKHKTGGLIWILCRKKSIKDQNNKIKGVICTHTNICSLKETEDKLYLMAHFDPLTQLPNRSHFITLLANTIDEISRSNKQFALFYMDIDNFKWVNDKYGHAVGDAFLRVVANKLKSLARGFDITARLGGDEFGLIIKEIHSVKEVEEIAARYIEAFSKVLSIEACEISTSLSIGIVLFPQGGTTPNELLEHADEAMYYVKDSGRNDFYFFNQEIRHKLSRYHSIDTQLLHAIDRDEFSLVYQPKFDLNTGQMVGVEALLRWSNEILGNIPPIEFIAIAEANKQIIPIGRWVMTQAIKDYEIMNQIAKKNTLSLAINVSIVQIIDPDFAPTVKLLLNNADILPENLFLEFTDTALVQQLLTLSNGMRLIAKMGVRFTLDNFCHGSLSLSSVKNLPIYGLKVGKAFVDEIKSNKNDGKVVNAVISLAKNLGLHCTTGCIETNEQYTFLKKTTCDEGQGYFFSKPLSLKDLLDFMHASI